MLLGPDSKPIQYQPPPKAKMHKCLWCGRRSRLGTKCCNARYREDSKFNSETRHQRLDRLDRENERELVKESLK